MQPHERFLAIFDDDQRKRLDRVPLFVQNVNSDFIEKNEEELFADLPQEAVGIANWDAAWWLGFDAIFGDLPSCMATKPIEIIDENGVKQTINSEGRVYHKNSTFYDHGLVHSLEIVEQLWANTRKLDNQKSIAKSMEYYDSLANKLYLIPRTGGLFSRVWLGMGYAHFSRNFLKKTKVYQEFVRFRAEILQNEVQSLVESSNGKAKAIFIADDVAYKGRTLISPERWLSDFGPYYRKICKLASDNGIIPLLHTDGDITELIPAFQDVGFRGLQGWEGGIDPKKINQQFPEFVVIGFADMNEVLPFGSKQQIIQHVKELMDIFKENRHYMIGPSSVINATMPIQNVRNFVQAAKKLGMY